MRTDPPADWRDDPKTVLRIAMVTDRENRFWDIERDDWYTNAEYEDMAAGLLAALAAAGYQVVKAADVWTEYGVRTSAGWMAVGGRRVDDRDYSGPYADPDDVRRGRDEACRLHADWQPINRQVGPWTPVDEEHADG